MIYNYIIFAVFVIDLFAYIHKEWLEYISTHKFVEVLWFFSFLLSILYMVVMFVWALNNANFIR